MTGPQPPAAAPSAGETQAKGGSAPAKIGVRVTWNEEEIVAAKFLDDQVWIGRSPDSDLIIDDPSVSRHHALLVRRAPGRYSLQDLQSLNGIRRDGRRVESWNINHGDLIDLGEFVLSFTLQESQPEEEKAASAEAADAAALFGATVAMTPETHEKAIKERSAKVFGWLKPSDGREDEPTPIDRDAFTVGNSVLADLRIEARGFPEWCALVVREPSGFGVHNVSSNPKAIRLDRTPVSGWAELKNGSVVQFFDHEYVFYRDALPAPPAKKPTPSSKPAPTMAPAHDWTQKPERAAPKIKPAARVSRRFKRPPSVKGKGKGKGKGKASTTGLASKLPPWVKMLGGVVWGLALLAFFVKVIISLSEVF